MRRAGFIGALLCLRWVASAGGASEATEEELLFLLEERVSVASRHEETTRDAPASVSVITADDLARFGDRTVGEALERVPGWYVSRSHETDYVGVRGYNTSGEYNREVMVLMNGQPLNENWSASVYVDEFLEIDVSLIDRIEVLSGPTSTLYGTNAFFGIINIITKGAKSVGPFVATVKSDSLGGVKTVLQSGESLESGFSYVAEGSVLRHDGVSYTFEEYGRASEDTDRDRKWDGFMQLSYKGFSFQAGYSTRRKAVPTAPYGTVFNDSRNVYTFDWGFAEAKYRSDLGERATLTAQLLGNLYEYNDDLFYDDDPENYPGGYLFHDTGDDLTLGTQWQLDMKISGHNKLFAGLAAARSDTQSHSSVVEPPGDVGFTIPTDISTYAAYVQDEIDTGKLHLSLGLRYDTTSKFESSLSPRVGIVWHMSEGGNAKLIVGKGFRNPSPYEAFFDDGYSIYPNPDLRPEVLWNYEAVYEHRVKTGYFFRGSVYAIRGEDLFRQVTVNLGTVPCEEEGNDCRQQMHNVGRTRGVGSELVFEARPMSGMRAYASVGYQDITDPDSSFDFFNSPKWLVKAGLSQPLFDHRLFLGADVTYVSERVAVDESDITVDPITYLDLTAYAPRLLKHLDLTVAMKNALDEKAFEPAVSEDIAPIQRIPQEGRSIRAQVSYRF